MAQNYGNLMGYEPAEQPGAYRFLTRDGRKVLGFGPEAEALKAKLDQANAMGPQKTADASDYLGFSPAALVRDKPPVATDVGGPVMSAAPPDEPTTANGLASANPNAAKPGGMSLPADALESRQPVAIASPNPGPAPVEKPAPGPQYVPVYRKADGTTVEMRIGADPNNPMPGDIREFHPGSRGSKGGLVLRSQTESGGFEPNEAYQHGKQAIALERMQRLEAERQAQDEHFENQQVLLQDARVKLADQEAENIARAQAIDDGVRQATAKRDAAVNAYTGAKVDPGRALAGGKNWIYALFAGMSTFGSGLLKSPNYGVQILQQRIADDIDAQKAEIAVKRDAADNALADLTRQLGSQDRARLALEQIQNRLLVNSVEQAQGRKENVEKMASLENLKLALLEQEMDRAEKYRIDSQGEVTKNIVNMPRTGARAAGHTLPTAESVQGVKGVLAPQLKPGETGAGAPKKSAEQARYENTLTAAERTLDDFIEAHGGKRNPETGEISGSLKLPTDWPGPDSPDVGSAKSTLTSLGMVYANMQNAGAEAGQPTKEALTPGIGLTDEPTGALQAMSREIALRKQQAGGGTQ